MAASLAKTNLTFCKLSTLNRICSGALNRRFKNTKNYNQDLRPEHVHRADPQRIDEEPGPWKNYTDLEHWKKDQYKRKAVQEFDMESLNSVLQQMDLNLETENDQPVKLENPYQNPRKKCTLCQYDLQVNYKNPKLLSQFVSPYTGRIYGRHVTGLCIHMQKRVTREIKTARRLGFMGTHHKLPQFLEDPMLFDAFKRK